MKDVNQELEGPEEFDGYPEPVDRDESTETDGANDIALTAFGSPQIPTSNAAGIAYPSIQRQLEYWKTHDHGGNVLSSRIEANKECYQHPKPCFCCICEICGGNHSTLDCPSR